MPRPGGLTPGAPPVLHRDAAVLVIDKPAGLAVHAGPRGGASLEDLLPALRFGKRRLPQPAHRLDADTAGCLVLGRTHPALVALGRLFAAGAVGKLYWAVVRGVPGAPAGVVELPLRKVSSAAAGWRMIVDPAGLPARTHWTLLGQGGGLALLALRPETGRTHQLRVHCAALGLPIHGDARYGTAAPGGLHLLARRVMLPATPDVPGCDVTAPVPGHWATALARVGNVDIAPPGERLR